MKLKTEIIPIISKNTLNYKHNLFFIGSCFSENISGVLEQRKFSTYSNPFGISYNPISVFNSLNTILAKTTYTSKDLFFHNEVWSSFDFHSDMSFLDQDKMLEHVNSSISKANSYLKKTNYLFITLGTAWVYTKDNQIVANCHKIANSKFKKRLLSIQEIVSKANRTIAKILAVKNNIKIVFTVSPVRHLKDGFIENNQSKSTLLLAVKQICESFNEVSYFPSYEMVLDDLRDYRFYKEDLLHPNKMAIRYVYEKFAVTFFSKQTKDQVLKVEKINKSLQHKVKFKETKAYYQFKKSILKNIAEMERQGFDYSLEKTKLD